ncbi:hypothetical protein GCM10027055_02260 [Janibacter alkaliphilus]
MRLLGVAAARSRTERVGALLMGTNLAKGAAPHLSRGTHRYSDLAPCDYSTRPHGDHPAAAHLR